MSSFKVLHKEKYYKDGVVEDFVREGMFAISIAGSSQRKKQCEEVQVGDIFYLIDKNGNHYWKGEVISEFLKPPRPTDGGLSPLGFWKKVEGKRKNKNIALTWEGEDERVCIVNWGEKTVFPSVQENGYDLKEKLNSGFNAKTIKRVYIDN